MYNLEIRHAFPRTLPPAGQFILSSKFPGDQHPSTVILCCPLHQQPCGAHSKVPSLDERDRGGDPREMRKIEGEPFLSAGASPGVYVASAVVFKQDGTSDTRGRCIWIHRLGYTDFLAPPTPASVSDSAGLEPENLHVYQIPR